jgi:hypothetical protein
MEIAEWAKHRKEELVKILRLEWSRMPHHNTYRRILAEKMHAEEIERLVGEYNQRGDHGQVYAMDGKAMLGKRRDSETGTEYLLSVYDVEQAKVLSQVEVGRKENEITKAAQVLKQVEIAQKVVTGDAMHTQRGVSRQIIEAGGDCLAGERKSTALVPEYSEPLCSRISQTRLWENPHRFPDRSHGEQRSRTH